MPSSIVIEVVSTIAARPMSEESIAAAQSSLICRAWKTYEHQSEQSPDREEGLLNMELVEHRNTGISEEIAGKHRWKT